MALTNQTIKKRLASVSSNLVDNEAQEIVNKASSHELNQLDIEGVLRLFEALAITAPRIFSRLDKEAMNRLKQHSQFKPIANTLNFAVNLVKKNNSTLADIQLLTTGLVKAIYAAEKKRLSFDDILPIGSIGRGQLGNDQYADVKRAFKTSLNIAAQHAIMSKVLANPLRRSFSSFIDFKSYKIKTPDSYRAIVSYFPLLEDFVVSAYLALKIKSASASNNHPGRSKKDVLRFAVAVYHGMYLTINAAQTGAKDKTNWAPIVPKILEQKGENYQDKIDYVNEVVK